LNETERFERIATAKTREKRSVSFKTFSAGYFRLSLNLCDHLAIAEFLEKSTMTRRAGGSGLPVNNL
jgi:hypothetical protein